MDKKEIKDILTKYPIVLSQEHFDKLATDLKSLMDSAVEERGKCNTCKGLLPVECETCKRLWES